jgi:hypothetical protein
VALRLLRDDTAARCFMITYLPLHLLFLISYVVKRPNKSP